MTISSPPSVTGETSSWRRLGYWVMAVRPRTLPLGASPVLLGTALAWQAGTALSLTTFLATLFSAVLIQAGTNLHNDAADGERGVDGPARRGPPRATAMGWLPASQVRAAAYICFALAAVAGLHLVSIGGWPILVIGVLSLMCGLAYSSGPLPISYTPLGEVFVLAFFGIGAVGGTYLLQAGALTLPALIGGAMLGLQAAAVLHLNNMRDCESDAAAGRRTLAIQVGHGASVVVYAALMLAPYLLLVGLWVEEMKLPIAARLLPMLSLPVAVTMVRSVATARSGADFNRLLAGTAQLEAAFAVLLCVALVVLP